MNNDTKPLVITKQDLNRIIINILQNKVPGFNYIYYNLIKCIHNATQELLLTLFNTYLNYNYFPKSFKIGAVVLFYKKVKDTKHPKNYIPIYLYPEISKILEKIFHGESTTISLKVNYGAIKNTVLNRGYQLNTC